MTEEELRTIVDVSHEDGVIESDEKKMIYNVFDLGDADAKDIMVPRVNVSLAQRQEGMDSDIKEIKKDVNQMAQRSGRRWDMIVEKAIAAIAGALVGFILLKLGLG